MAQLIRVLRGVRAVYQPKTCRRTAYGGVFGCSLHEAEIYWEHFGKTTLAGACYRGRQDKTCVLQTRPISARAERIIMRRKTVADIGEFCYGLQVWRRIKKFRIEPLKENVEDEKH